MLNQIFTVGYQSFKNIGEIVELSRQRQAIIADIRYQPWSKNEQWQEREIQLTFFKAGLYQSYYWVRPLGNVNYRDGGPVKFSDLEKGIEQIRKFAEQKPVILMCACWDLMTCHRLVAAELLEKELGVTVEHILAVPKEVLPKPEKVAPPPPFWNCWETYPGAVRFRLSCISGELAMRCCRGLKKLNRLINELTFNVFRHWRFRPGGGLGRVYHSCPL